MYLINFFAILLTGYMLASILEFFIFLIFPVFYDNYMTDAFTEFSRERSKAIILSLIVTSIFFFSLFYWDSISNEFFKDILWDHSDRIICTIIMTLAMLFGNFSVYARNNIDISDASRLLSWLPLSLKAISLLLVLISVSWTPFWNFFIDKI